MAEPVYMLTTRDNPFNPHTHPNEWNAYDEQLGHYTNSFLARMVHTSHELSESDQEKAIDQAILEIVARDETGLYLRVSSEGPFLGAID